MKDRKKNQPIILPTQIGAGLPLGQRGYFRLSSQPLHTLIFLLPVIAVYEIGSMGLLGTGVSSRLEAQEMLVRFFDLFGVLGLHLPALALVVTLVVQQFLSRASWKISPMVPLAMIAESAFLTGPLIVFAIILEPQSQALMIPAMQVVAETAGPATGMMSTSDSFWEGIFLAFGAGLYEEMLFRLVLITILHFMITDVLSFKDRTGKIAAVILSAIAFAWLHDSVYTASGGLNIRLAAFYTLAGAYFGILFLSRGLGIAVGAHLMYDLLVFVIMPGIQDQT
ncbi:MAG: CPBP family intramembrane metalloprotease [Phycisphaerales bacterium]|nr:CPBP family intramembrane metalloprotease [Phycisphaerales bacterium]